MRILCAIALLCVGFAHKPPLVSSTASIADLASYMLPDGTVPILCLTGESDGTKHPGDHIGNGCEVCRLAACAILPTPADSIGEALIVATDVQLPIRREAFYRQLFPPSAPPRGPPAGLIS
ncbi:hypothetical protein [Rhizobium sp. FY34]|uniref:hypothetical protein n=1 Tax=Rhizobium sp. FY34 TaxID=2562309 RepID=UPI001FEFB6F6|nr:hypothetical protein [Rhizobium sp. FY34]